MAGDLKRLYPVRVAPISLQTKKFRHAPTHAHKYTLTHIPVQYAHIHSCTQAQIIVQTNWTNIQISAYKKALTQARTFTNKQTD